MEDLQLEFHLVVERFVAVAIQQPADALDQDGSPAKLYCMFNFCKNFNLPKNLYRVVGEEV